MTPPRPAGDGGSWVYSDATCLCGHAERHHVGGTSRCPVWDGEDDGCTCQAFARPASPPAGAEIPYMLENTREEFERVRDLPWPPAGAEADAEPAPPTDGLRRPSEWSRDLGMRLLNGILTVDEMARTIEADERIQWLIAAEEALREVRDWDSSAAERHGGIGVREFARRALDGDR